MHLILRARHSGAEILVRALALAHQAKGAQIAVCSLGRSAPEFQPDVEQLRSAGVTTYLAERELSRWERVRHLRAAVRGFQPDVIVAHSVIPAIYARISWLRLPCPVVTVLHAANCDDYSSGALLERILSRRARAIVAVNPRAIRSYQARVGPHETMLTIENGIDLRRFRDAAARRAELRRQFGVPEAGRIVLQVGRMHPSKGQLYTIDALGDVAGSSAGFGDPALQLWLVGPEEDREYEALCRSRAGGLAVDFLPADPAVEGRMAAADVVVVPSIEESQGLVFVEALASGRPVVASDIPEFRRYADQERVWLVDPRDRAAFARAIGDALSAAVAGERDLEGVSVERCAERYSSLLQRLT